MFNDQKISIRIPSDDYKILFNIFESYKNSCPSLTFSDFIRNLLCQFIAKIKGNENKTDFK